ncbi:MAG: YibE/F family protein [Actinomycetota bacterium]|nr:YibE/F family protein [Actinomycetota bacterium]
MTAHRHSAKARGGHRHRSGPKHRHGRGRPLPSGQMHGHAPAHSQGHAHSHGHRALAAASSSRIRPVLLLAVVPLLAATVVGIFILWPSEPPDVSEAVDLPDNLVEGTVMSTTPTVCPGIEDAGQGCSTVRVRLTSGPQNGEVVSFQATDPSAILSVSAGDDIVLTYSPEAPQEFAYDFADRQRKAPLGMLALLFAAVVVALGRWRGFAALLGFGISLGVIIFFVLPSILEGNNPLAVAIVGSAAVMFVALYVAHGVNELTTTAVLGTMASLLITGALAFVFVRLTRLSGFASEEAIFVKVAAEQLNLEGMLLGGIIIGSLGVLDDVTITQASAVWELHGANAALGPRELYRSAIRIGRDHIASTVNTLVLAYAGASLPLLLLFTISESRLTDVLNGEVVAQEIVRTLVGSIGLVASVPITTALAVLVARSRTRVEPPPEDNDGRASAEASESPAGTGDSFWTAS